MYSEQCKSCIVEGCPDSCHVKQAYKRDLVEVVRCKDCKHWEKTWKNDWAKDYHYCIMVDGVRKVDFYCADAERRSDED